MESVNRTEITVTVGEGSDVCPLGILDNSVSKDVINGYMHLFWDNLLMMLIMTFNFSFVANDMYRTKKR